MKGLLLNDWYALKRPATLLTMAAFIIMIVVIAFFGTSPDDSTLEECRTFVACFSLMSVVVMMSFLSADEVSKWQQYYVNTPASRHAYVSEKYLLGLVMSALFSLFLSLPSLVLMLRQGSFEMKEYLLSLVLAFAVPLITVSLVFPFSLRFGTSKGAACFLIIFMVIMGALAALTVLSALFTGESKLVDFFFKTDSSVMALCVLAAAAVCFGLSWPISFAAFRHRQY